MTVSYVAAYTNDDTNGGATNTVTGVNGAAGDFVVALLSWRRNDGDENCTGITYDGNAMTRAGSGDTVTPDGSQMAGAVFYYVNPAGSSVNVVASLSGATPPGNHQMSVLVFSGVDTGSPIGTVVANSANSGTTPSNDAASATGDMVVELFADRNGNPSATASQDIRATLDGSSSVDHRATTKAGASSVTFSWSQSNLYWVQILVPINQASGGSPAIAAFARGSNIILKGY